MVLIYILAYINLNFFEEVCIEKTVFQNSTISIYGDCYDIGTGVGISAKGKVLVGSGDPILISSDPSGVLNFQIPASATAIVFESSGYRKEVIPIHPIASSTGDQKYQVSIPMSRVDSMPVVQKNQLSLSFLVMEDIEVNYEISYKKNPKILVSCTYNSKYTPKNLRLVMPNQLGDYLITATTNNGELLYTEEINMKEGINFKTLVVTGKKLNTEQIETLPGIGKKDKLLILFNQSDYVLNDSSKTNLDALSALLLNNAQQRVKIVGHTDNAGKENLNVTLSEYRARVVAQYLLKKGVPQSQIELDWKGSSLPVSSNDSEEQRKLNRRVEIQLFD